MTKDRKSTEPNNISNYDMFRLILELQEQTSKQTDLIEELIKTCKEQDSQIKTLGNIVSVNEIALNNLEKKIK